MCTNLAILGAPGCMVYARYIMYLEDKNKNKNNIILIASDWLICLDNGTIMDQCWIINIYIYVYILYIYIFNIMYTLW